MVAELSKFGSDKCVATIFVKHDQGKVYHVGVVHKTREGNEVNLLHFGDDKLVLDEKFVVEAKSDKEFSYVIPLNFSEEDQVMLAMVCRNFKLRLDNQNIRYGLLYNKGTKLIEVKTDQHEDEIGFSSPKLKLILGEGCSGLTCATFVMALFSHLEFELVDIDNWPQPDFEDYMWFGGWIARSKQEGVEEEQIKNLMQEANSAKRFRPPHVAASMSCGCKPAPFKCLEVKASEMRSLLQ